MSKEGLPVKNVELDYSRNVHTVGDGECAEGGLNHYVFPGVGGCIPTIIKEKEGEILAAIHVSPIDWTPDRLKAIVEEARSRTTAEIEIDCLERVNIPGLDGGTLGPFVWDDAQNRLNILNAIDEIGTIIPVSKSVQPADNFVEHIGYYKDEGFVRLVIE